MADGFPDNRLPARGTDADAVLARMGELRADDRDWKGGRVFSLVYSAGDDVHDLLQRASNLYSAENALNTMVFPSLGWMQHDIVTITAGLLGADRAEGSGSGSGAVSGAVSGSGSGSAAGEVRGYLTSGGTESLLQATKTARDWGRDRDRPIERPNMVLATSAHAAFEKAAHYFDVESRRVAVGADFRADPDAMADAVDDHTVMVVGSAPSYPQGVIDPIPDLAGVAIERGILCHVDACLGGFILPFLGQLGHVTKPWDLSVPGVTSISADLHKYGYASKGVSVVLYGSRELARLQPFITSNWLGGLYGSPRWPAPGPPVRSPPAGRCSSIWGTTAICAWPRTPGRRPPPSAQPSRGHRVWPCGGIPTPPSSPSAGCSPTTVRALAVSTASRWAIIWPSGAAGTSTGSHPRTASMPPSTPVMPGWPRSWPPTSGRWPPNWRRPAPPPRVGTPPTGPGKTGDAVVGTAR
ncbi:MAG TPA: aminotransferase class V-fold PLP-dependent enzyme [Acidimicrobiales bacterium]|nr:aminotransferase class V-fold PLP-dependent enzyme [Acidimicrobiales bacterium]